MHAAELRRCLLQLDVQQARRLWAHIAPHLPQPRSDDEALETLHRARIEARSVPQLQREYSKAWVAERDNRRIAAAVGISVNAPEHRKSQAQDTRMAMECAVLDAVKAGVSLIQEPTEIKRRMLVARRKVG